ncbi:MAG: hypothetical protein WAX47_05245, partial [Trichococcus flocculiformis]
GDHFIAKISLPSLDLNVNDTAVMSGPLFWYQVIPMVHKPGYRYTFLQFNETGSKCQAPQQ